jgi:hypothetical protein
LVEEPEEAVVAVVDAEAFERFGARNTRGDFFSAG